MQLVLASQSPRRRQMLDERGIAYRAMHPGVDDALLEPGGAASPAQWAAALAYLKAAAGALACEGAEPGAGHLVLGADTVVVKGALLLGQPTDAADAARMIGLLEDGEHEVITGVAVVWRAPAAQPGAPGRTGQDGQPPRAAGLPEHREVFVDRARVRVGRIGPERIAAYVASGMWKGKAGGYNLSERLAAGWPIEYDGDAGTIMGLPLGKLVDRLRRLGHTVEGPP